jgi:hypothetical protein
MKTMLAFIVSVMLLTSGCGFAHRHPTQVKVYALVSGAAAGIGLGMYTRTHFCHYTYEGQPYYGSDCPAPRPVTGLKRGGGQ